MRTRANRFLARVPRRSGGVGLFEVPRLEELVADPDKVGVLDSYATWALRAQAIAALNLLNAQDLRLLRRDSEGAHEIRLGSAVWQRTLLFRASNGRFRPKAARLKSRSPCR